MLIVCRSWHWPSSPKAAVVLPSGKFFPKPQLVPLILIVESGLRVTWIVNCMIDTLLFGDRHPPIFSFVSYEDPTINDGVQFIVWSLYVELPLIKEVD